MSKGARPFYVLPDLGAGHRGRVFRRLLDEAVRLVRRGRIPSVAEVAQSAGVSRATAYRYFPSRSKLVSAVIMGFAITGMHYTGMAAARFAPDSICLTGASVDNSWMAGTIAGFTFLILCVTLVLSIYDAHMASKTARMAASLKQANEELQLMALQDGLTKLPNRVLLEDRLGQAIAHAQRSRSRCLGTVIGGCRCRW